MAKTLLFGGVLGQFHPCEHEQQALWLGLATGGVQEIPEIGEAHAACVMVIGAKLARRSEEHTSELQSLMRISYAVFCLKKKKINQPYNTTKIPYSTTMY